jgi:hypothetical protein
MREKYPTKKQWGPGPWQDEPDEAEWVNEATGYKCRILRVPHTGSLCGYVVVPETHPAFGLSYDGDTYAEHQERMAAFRAELERTRGDIKKWRSLPAQEAFPGIGEAIGKVEVHGGLTYAGPGITHKDEWWFGFDCAHAGDLCPAIEALMHRIHIEAGDTRVWERQKALKAELGAQWQDTYRTLAYVRNECADLARQLKALEVNIDVTCYTSDRSK